MQKKPFKFLDSYTKEDRDIFFGRETETRELFYKAHHSRITIVYGESGTGKSSLVQCGLFAELDENAQIFNVRTGANPLANLDKEIFSLLNTEQEEIFDYSEIFEKIYKKCWKKQLILFDQFEEFFILKNMDTNEVYEDRKNQFLLFLDAVLNCNSDVAVVICIREDYFAKLSEFEHVLPRFLENRVWVAKMHREKAKEVIEKPCAACNVKIDKESAGNILDSLKDKSGSVELPLLQVVMDELYKKALERNSSDIQIEISDNDQSWIGNILAVFLDNQVNKFGDDSEDAKVVLKAMITGDGTKKQVTVEDILAVVEIEADKLAAILEELTNGRVIKKDADLLSYELRHDILAKKIFEFWMTGLEKELAEIKNTIDIMFNQYKARGILLDETIINEIAIYETKLNLKDERLEFVNHSRKVIKSRISRKRNFYIYGITLVGLVSVVFSLLMLGAYNKVEQNLKGSYFIAAQALYEKAKLAEKENNDVLIKIYSTASVLYQSKAEKYFSNESNIHSELNLNKVKKLLGNNYGITSMSYSSDGKHLAISSYKLIKIWDVETAQVLKILRGHRGNVTSVKYSKDSNYLLSSSEDKTIKIWDMKTYKEKLTLRGHKNFVTSVDFSQNGQYVVSGSMDSTINVWNVKNGTVLKTIYGHRNRINSVVFCSNDKKIAGSSSDNLIKIWDFKTGSLFKTLSGHSKSIISLSCSNDGKILASGSSDNLIKLWNVESGKELNTLSGHSKGVTSVCFDYSGKYLVSGSDDKAIKLWDTSTGEMLKTLSEHSDKVTSVCFGPNDRHLASSSLDKATIIWAVETGKYCKTLKEHSDAVVSVTTSPNGLYLASSSCDKTIKIWNLKAGKELNTLIGHKDVVTSINFSHDNKYIVSGSWDKSIRLWDVNTGLELKKFLGHSSKISSVDFSQNGKYIASGSYDKTIKIWDLNSGKEIKTLNGHRNRVYSVIFSPNDRYLASGSSDKTIKLWDIKSGKEVETLNGHRDIVMSVDFDSNGRHLASGSIDKTIKIWSIETGKEIKTLSGTNNKAYPIYSAVFSPNGKYVVSGGECNSIKLWDIKSGKEIKTMSSHYANVNSIVYSPDGNYLISGSSDKTIKIWDIKLLWLGLSYPYQPDYVEKVLYQLEKDTGYKLDDINAVPVE